MKHNIIIQGLHICAIGVLIWAFLSFYILFCHLSTVPKSLLVNHEIVNSETTIAQTEKPKADPCGGRYIYVHELPSRFNKDIVDECGSINPFCDMCKLIINNGFGPASNNSEGVLSDNGWYNTNQWNLDLIFNTRMKQYECLTNDSSMAAAIFVPFYAGFDAQKYLYGYNNSIKDAASLALVDWLQKRGEWKRMNGKDHFLAGGRTTWNFRRPIEDEFGSGNSFLNLPVSKNMSMLLIESNPWCSNDFAIPYPTYFHPSRDSDVFDWLNRVMQWNRKWLFSFVGETRRDPGSIRSHIIDQCKNSSVGEYLECGYEEINCHSPSSIINTFGRSIFCLQPRGDTPTRRSTFDSILAGCIPVFFHPDSFYTQYTWHVPLNYTEYSVFISEDDIHKNVSIEQRLSQIDPIKIDMMRKEVINLIPRLVYARSKLDTLKDAFDISVEEIINKVTQLRQDMLHARRNDDFVEEVTSKDANKR